MAGKTLNRVLGKGFSIAACVGMVVGLGIMRTPGEIAATVSTPVPYLLLWIGGGIFVLLSLLIVAELIAMTPRSGGIYAMVAHAYGPYPGFVIGWTDWVSNCASNALKAVVMLEYLSLLIPEVSAYRPYSAIFVTTCFASLQLVGTRISGTVQQLASAGIGLIILCLTGALFYGAIRNGGPLIPIREASSTAALGIASYGLVVAAIVYTYDGWYTASYFSGEVKAGGRAVAIGSLQGTLIVIALYVLLNLALVSSVPLSDLGGHDLALAGAMDLVFGGGAGSIIIVAAVFILLAHQNMQYMTGCRILYALSVDGLGSQYATNVTDRGTPAGAVIITWITVVGLILIGQFEFLLNLAAILFVIMYVSLVVGVFRLRRQEPETERPFLAWGFPYTGVFCAAGWTAVALYVAVTSPESTFYAAILVVVSAPAYLWLKRRRHLTAA